LSRKVSWLEELFKKQLEEAGLLYDEEGKPAFQEEYKFLKDRRFRFDFAWVGKMVAVEIEGGIWNKSRHTNPSGFEKDCEKYNLATKAGWMVFRFGPTHVKNGTAIEFIKELIYG